MNFKLKLIDEKEFDKLRKLFPGNDEMWNKYKEKRLQQFAKNDISIYVIEYNETFIGEITINYSNHDLQTETIPNERVYLEAFRLSVMYQGKGLGQQLIKFAINDLISKGYSEFTIGVEDDNNVAKHIYNKLGFTTAIDKGYGNEFDPCEYTLYLRKKNLKSKQKSAS